jgi:4-amino-4-deoxy-L-arabinose transferase-like glycosyltransferase
MTLEARSRTEPVAAARARNGTWPSVTLARYGWPLAIFTLAFVLRVFLLAFVNPDPSDGRYDDSVWYDSSARSIAAGDGYTWDPTVWVFQDGAAVYPGETDTAPSAVWPPGYPAFLAAVYKLTGGSLIAAKLANAALAAASAVLVYLIARRVFDERSGVIAGVITALFPGLLFFTTVTMAEVLFTFLLLLIVFVVLRWAAPPAQPRPALLVALGALIGAAALTRGELSLFPIALFLVLLALHRSWITAFAWTGLIAVGMAVAFLPWIVRNRVQMDAWVIGTTGVGRVMLQGHNPEADGRPDLYVPLTFESQFQDLPLPEREVRAGSEAQREAIDWALAHPLEELKLIPKRIYYMWREDQAGVKWMQSNKPTFADAANDRWLAVSDGYYFGVLALAILGAPAWLAHRRDPRLLLILAPIAYYVVIFGVFFIGDDRYHVPVLPLFSILAAVPLAALAGRVAGTGQSSR